MDSLKIKKKSDGRLKRIEELEKRLKNLVEPTKGKAVGKKGELPQKKTDFFELFKFKKEMKKPKKDVIKEVHITVKEATRMGTIKIETAVKDIMITEVKSVNLDDNLREVLDLLSQYKIAGVPVVSKKKVVGVLSQSDIMDMMDKRGILDPVKDVIKLSELEKIKVNDIMSKKPILINQNEKITDASDLMSKHDVDRLLVVDDKKNVVGIVTWEDIIRGMTNEFFAKSVEAGGNVIETQIDNLIRIVENRRTITITELSEELGVTPDQVEEWANILEERGIIDIEYPPIGPLKLRTKK